MWAFLRAAVEEGFGISYRMWKLKWLMYWTRNSEKCQIRVNPSLGCLKLCWWFEDVSIVKLTFSSKNLEHLQLLKFGTWHSNRCSTVDFTCQNTTKLTAISKLLTTPNKNHTKCFTKFLICRRKNNHECKVGATKRVICNEDCSLCSGKLVITESGMEMLLGQQEVCQ